MDPQRKGWVRVGEEGGETRSSRRSRAAAAPTAGRGHPPPKPPTPPHAAKKPTKLRHFESTKEDDPHPKPRAKVKPKTKRKAKPPPWRIGAGTPMGMCRVWGAPGTSLEWRGAMGGTVGEVTVLEDGDEQLDPGD